ncbi:hypothetical protein ACT8ZV_02340 [Nocardioides sp. MAHUQ-72]|uniref:hypothetical protein n=1 Tax=unclassified Nocardioides TaxID=2615069 RepID=UPI0036223902
MPPDARVTQYWAATVHDRDTQTFLREVPRPFRLHGPTPALIDKTWRLPATET